MPHTLISLVQEIPTILIIAITSNYRVGSVCVGEPGVKAEIMYASMDCASYFDPIGPRNPDIPNMPHCMYLYTNLGDCCPSKLCDVELMRRAKCDLGAFIK